MSSCVYCIIQTLVTHMILNAYFNEMISKHNILILLFVILYDAWGVITWCLRIMKLWWIVYKWQVEYVLNCKITRVLRCCMHWVMSYELFNHMIVRPFKGNELMHDEYFDGIHCGNPMSWITLRHDELKLFWEQLRSRIFCMVYR